jgi:hypothetical protein
MPRLACWSCGRHLYATTPVDALAAEERHCPECGAILHVDRRSLERRHVDRRQNPPDFPGPPSSGERRIAERRRFDRRHAPG